MQNHAKLHETTRETTRNHAKPRKTMLPKLPKTPKTMQNHKKPRKTTQNHVKLSRGTF